MLSSAIHDFGRHGSRSASFIVMPHDHESLPQRWSEGPEVALLGAAFLAIASDVLAFPMPCATLFVAPAALAFGAARVLGSPRTSSRFATTLRLAAVIVALVSPLTAYAGRGAYQAHRQRALAEATHSIVMFQVHEGRWPSSLDVAFARELPSRALPEFTLWRLSAPRLKYAPPADPVAANHAALAHTKAAGWYTTGPTLTYDDASSFSRHRQMRFVPGGYFQEE